MTPALFVALLAGGLLLAASVLHVGGFTRDGRFDDPAAVVDALRRQRLTLVVRAVHLSDDRRAALVETDGDRWLVTFLGLRPFARPLRAADGTPTARGVAYELGFDAPNIDVILARPSTAWLGQRGAR